MPNISKSLCLVIGMLLISCSSAEFTGTGKDDDKPAAQPPAIEEEDKTSDLTDKDTDNEQGPSKDEDKGPSKDCELESYDCEDEDIDCDELWESGDNDAYLEHCEDKPDGDKDKDKEDQDESEQNEDSEDDESGPGKGDEDSPNQS